VNDDVHIRYAPPISALNHGEAVEADEWDSGLI